MLVEGMYLIYTSKDGPVAASYTRAVADRALYSLKILYPGARVWLTESSSSEVGKRQVEVLASLDDAELAVAYRVVMGERGQSEGAHRETLRGLVISRGVGNGRLAQGEGFTLELAARHAKFASEACPADHRVRFHPMDLGLAE